MKSFGPLQERQGFHICTFEASYRSWSIEKWGLGRISYPQRLRSTPGKLNVTWQVKPKTSSCKVFPSWTVITPSFPTSSMALAINSPIALSLFAEIVATCNWSVLLLFSCVGYNTWAISSRVLMGLVESLSLRTTSSTALSIPRLRSMGFIPAATALQPSL